jgi:hypothetical protein
MQLGKAGHRHRPRLADSERESQGNGQNGRRVGEELFDDRERVDSSPPSIGESLFEYVDRMAGVLWTNVRAQLSEWVQDFPAEHRQELLGRLRSRSDPVDFYAAYWELFLHQLLKRGGFNVEYHPAVLGTAKRPDFRAVRGDEVVYIEAKLIGNSADEKRRQREKDEIWTELDRRVSSEQFFVRLGVLERGRGAIPHRLLAAATSKWLAGLDAEAVRAAVAIGGLGAVEKFVWRDTGSGWAVSLAPIPKTRHLHSHRLVGMGEAEAWFSDDRVAIRRALADKGHRYGRDLDAPFVVALSMGRSFVDDFDVVNALFGDEVVHVRHDTEETSLARARNGVWVGPRG